jgi:hypothetical protein
MRKAGLFLGLLTLVLGACGALAQGAGAKAQTLQLYYNSSIPLTTGQSVEEFDPGWTLETASGDVTCEAIENNQGFSGLAETNNEKVDKISSQETFGALFSNTGCTSTLPLIGSTAEGFWFNGNSFGSEVHGQFKYSSKGTVEYVSAGKLETVIEVRANAGSGARCYFEVGKLKSKLTLPSLTTEFAAQKLKLVKFSNSSALCPKKATVTTEMAPYVQLGEGNEAPVQGKLV